jgi:glutathione S-transferase
METHLTKHDYFVAGRFTIADIALYAYTHVAHLADFDLTPYAAVRRWLDRVETQPYYVPMDWQPETLAAE